jgi:hypothetical protein
MTKFLFITTLFATLGFGFTSAASRTEITPAPTDETTALPAAVSISNGFRNVTNLGNGQYRSVMGAQGTLTTPNGTFSTAIGLDCDVDTVGETIDCEGLVRVGTAEVAIAAEYADGEVSYMMDQSASENQRRAWVNWHEVLVIDVLPPDDVVVIGDGDDGEDDLGDGGGDGGWQFPEIDIDGPLIIVRYPSDFTLILDGAILSQY